MRTKERRPAGPYRLTLGYIMRTRFRQRKVPRRISGQIHIQEYRAVKYLQDEGILEWCAEGLGDP